MPVAEYYCEKCGVFEMMLKLHELEENRILCPTCRSEVQRIFSPPAFSRPFSGARNKLLRRAEKGREPRVVRKGEGDPLEAALPGRHSQHSHDRSGGGSPGYPPWMIKH